MKLSRLIILIIAVLVIASAAIGILYKKSTNQALASDQTIFFSVTVGSSVTSVAQELQERQLIKSASTLIWLSRLGGSKPILATDYEFPAGTTIRQVYVAMTTGTMRSPERQVTIVEGLTLEQMAKVLEDAKLVENKEAFVTATSTNLDRFRQRYDFLASKPLTATLEGYLFPDTYRFLAKTTADDIITKMLDTFDAKLTAEMRASIQASGRTIHETVTLASILEREVRQPDEMREVSGLFLNRLEIKMPLQADSTINYLTKSGRDRSTLEDLQIDSPYNTYLYPGLPPAPISSPSLNALTAAVSPAKTEALYFLTDADGKVYYATTYDGHLRNRDLYLK
ncbi:MAG: endolytic transglycosylase MltG [Parcubacteria group bacterium]|nr:endolytic transglycosylase MltG [Parcubacteria group bacterium]